jgi:phage I-like protein
MSDKPDASLEQVVTPEGGRRVLSIKLDVTDLLPIAAPIAVPAATVPAELPAEPAATPAVIPARVPDAPITSRVVAFDAGQQATAALVDPADWNRQHALGRLRAWASSDGSGDRSTIDAEKLSAAFAWYDPDSAGRGTMSAFRLPHHDIRDGVLVVSRAGLLSAARAYMTGDVGIPDDDMGLCRLHLERHFAQLKEDPPWYTAPGATDRRVADGVVTLDARTKPGTIPGVLSVSWIQVAKVGTFRGHPMGPFAFTPEVFATIIANFLATENRMVPVDYEHATEALGESVFQDGAPAVGWIVELDNRGPDGLWGRVEWIDAAAVEHIRQGRYRYFSPAVAFNATDRVTGKAIGPTLVSGGLTNRPFLDGMAVVTAREPAPAIGAPIPDGVTPETAADTSPAVSTSPAATVVTASAVAPAAVEPAIETLPVTVEVAPAVTVAPATVLAPEHLPAKVRLRAELDAAWSRAPEKGLRTMSWHEGIEDREDLIEMLRYVLGLSKIAPEVEVMLGVAQLAVYVAGDLGERDGVDVREIVSRLRSILRLPALTTLEGVLAAIRSALQDPTFTEGAAGMSYHEPAGMTAAPSEMAVSPASVHIPAAISTAAVEPCSAAAAAETTLVSPGATCDMNATAIAAALNLSASASEEEILTAVNGLNGNVAAMSARLAAHDRKAAETEVDALIAQKRIDQEGRNGAVTLRLTQPENFLAMFPARAPVVEIAPAPAPAVVAPVVAAMRTAETPAAMSADMGVSVLPGNAGSTHLPPAGSVVKLPTSAQEHSEAVYTRATSLRKLDGTLSLRQAMIAAEDEIAADRRVLSAKV